MAATDRDKKLREAQAEDRDEDPMERARRKARENGQRSGKGTSLFSRLLRRIRP